MVHATLRAPAASNADNEQRERTLPLRQALRTIKKPRFGSDKIFAEPEKKDGEILGYEEAKILVSRDGVRQYRLNLARAVRYQQQMLARFRQEAWRGEVRVVVATVVRIGFPQVSLSESTGSDVLDKALLEMVRLAVLAVVVPEELRDREFTLTLPIRFDIDNW